MVMKGLLSEYRTNGDPVNQFVETCLFECEHNASTLMYEIIRAFRDFCACQGFDLPTERATKKRLCELLGPPTQQRYGQTQERHRGYIGYALEHPKEDNSPW